MSTSKYILLEDLVQATSHIKVRKGQEVVQLWHGPGAFKKFGYDEIDSNDNNSFKDSNYGWEYGTNYAGKVKTYKFDNIEKMPESKVRAEAFQFRTAESFLNSLNNKAKEKQVDISKYKEGQRIYHKKFGEGTIDKIEEEGEDYKLDINFDKVGHKRLMAKFAELEIIE